MRQRPEARGWSRLVEVGGRGWRSRFIVVLSLGEKRSFTVSFLSHTEKTHDSYSRARATQKKFPTVVPDFRQVVPEARQLFPILDKKKLKNIL